MNLEKILGKSDNFLPKIVRKFDLVSKNTVWRRRKKTTKNKILEGQFQLKSEIQTFLVYFGKTLKKH